MTAASVRVPSHLPDGTRFVVEGDSARDGSLIVTARYLVYPDGTRLDLLVKPAPRAARRSRRTQNATRRRRVARHHEERAAL